MLIFRVSEIPRFHIRRAVKEKHLQVMKYNGASRRHGICGRFYEEAYKKYIT